MLIGFCGDPVQSTPDAQGHSECGNLNQSVQGLYTGARTRPQ